MTALFWTRAAALLKLPLAAGWPAALEPMQLAALQAGFASPEDRREAHVIGAALVHACRSGKIDCEPAQRPAVAPVRRVVGSIGGGAPGRTQPALRTVTVFRIGPAAFLGRLAAQGLEPSALVREWSEATPAERAEPEGKRWTVERVAAARAMRDRLKAAGRRDFMAATARAYGVTPQRLREVLDPPAKPKPKAAATPLARLVHRLK